MTKAQSERDDSHFAKVTPLLTYACLYKTKKCCRGEGIQNSDATEQWEITGRIRRDTARTMPTVLGAIA